MMSKKVIIHIGFSKTGSTSIQKALANHVDDCYAYAAMGYPNHNRYFHALFEKPPYRLESLKHIATNSDKALQEVRNKWDNVAKNLRESQKTFIFSGENIADLDEAGLLRMKEYFNNLGRRVAIIGYVRHPLYYCPSSFQQMVKQGGISALPVRLNTHYRARVTRIWRVFGKENTSLSLYDSSMFHNSCVVADFCAKIGINYQKGELKDSQPQNKSLSASAVKCIYLYNKAVNEGKLTLASCNHRHKFISVVGKIFCKKATLKPFLFEQLFSRDDLDFLIRELGLNLFYPSECNNDASKSAISPLKEWIETESEEIILGINKWIHAQGNNKKGSTQGQAIQLLSEIIDKSTFHAA